VRSLKRTILDAFMYLFNLNIVQNTQLKTKRESEKKIDYNR